MPFAISHLPSPFCHLPSAIRAIIFGARNLAGLAGHARRSDNKQNNNRKKVINV
jgi:hypothetical protein